MSLSQQQNPFSIQSLPDYQTAFNNRIIPVDLTGHRYPSVQNIKFTDSVDQVATDLILIDSRARNWDTEEPYDYTVFLGQELQYVHSLELVDGVVPTSAYVISGHNNAIHFQETSRQVKARTYTTARVPVGNYIIATLVAQLSVSMTEASTVGRQYQCTVSDLTDRVTITYESHQVPTGTTSLI